MRNLVKFSSTRRNSAPNSMPSPGGSVSSKTFCWKPGAVVMLLMMIYCCNPVSSARALSFIFHISLNLFEPRFFRDLCLQKLNEAGRPPFKQVFSDSGWCVFFYLQSRMLPNSLALAILVVAVQLSAPIHAADVETGSGER